MHIDASPTQSWSEDSARRMAIHRRGLDPGARSRTAVVAAGVILAILAIWVLPLSRPHTAGTTRERYVVAARGARRARIEPTSHVCKGKVGPDFDFCCPCSTCTVNAIRSMARSRWCTQQRQVLHAATRSESRQRAVVGRDPRRTGASWFADRGLDRAALVTDAKARRPREAGDGSVSSDSARGPTSSSPYRHGGPEGETEIGPGRWDRSGGVRVRPPPLPLRRVVIVVPSLFTLFTFLRHLGDCAADAWRILRASWFIVFAGILDTLDGRVARISGTGTRSARTRCLSDSSASASPLLSSCIRSSSPAAARRLDLLLLLRHGGGDPPGAVQRHSAGRAKTISSACPLRQPG